MKYRFLYILIFIGIKSLGQSSCFCPENDFVPSRKGTKPETQFIFSNKKEIILCGYQENEGLFSEFILQVCGDDHVIDFWGATQSCRVSFGNDVLKVVEIKNFPVGKNREYMSTDWSIESFYFVDGELKHDLRINKAIRKYTKSEIEQTLSEFDKAGTVLDDSKLEIANRLFISAISGSVKAKQYFERFEHQFGELDGAFAEEYEDLKMMLKLYKAQ